MGGEIRYYLQKKLLKNVVLLYWKNYIHVEVEGAKREHKGERRGRMQKGGGGWGYRYSLRSWIYHMYHRAKGWKGREHKGEGEDSRRARNKKSIRRSQEEQVFEGYIQYSTCHYLV